MDSFFDSDYSKGRYRFQLGQALNPHEDQHPEMREQLNDISAEVPSTIEELLAMQVISNQNIGNINKSVKATNKVKMVLDMIKKIETNAAEDQEIALTILKHLEKFHDTTVENMLEEEENEQSQLVAWSVDADRLMHCRILLEKIRL